MNLECNYLSPGAVIEFGVGLQRDGQELFVAVPVDVSAQQALQAMVQTTEGLLAESGSPNSYEASEKYEAIEYVTAALDAEMCEQVRHLHEAANLETDSAALDQPESVFCYFTRVRDPKGRRLTAVRRAGYFKGALKGAFLRLFSDSLSLVPERLFRLDRDWDLIVDGKTVHILRPGGFEAAVKAQAMVLAAAQFNAKEIGKSLSWVNFEPIALFAASHVRAARALASIRSQSEHASIDKKALKALCKSTGVLVKEANGKLEVDQKDIQGFLEVLDRRRYFVELVKGDLERFRAGSRTKLVD